MRNSDYSDYEARSEAIFFSGLANIQIGNIDKGIKFLNEYLEHNETSADVVYWLGVAYYLLNDLDTAKEYFDSAIGQDPDFEKAYFVRGKISIKQGKWEFAMLDFHMALELNPENAEAQDFIGLVESIREKFNR